ncbi:hypothetical protein Nepgr_031547 [Nepenthes gracilis]|uniref:Uncharacterized protein n=1 Tax=Nepenthes gracilis TaxID=150966 RepID=A0AAD3TIH8_NEPGR|nr:hypothetical protein Nepgr_031547 [Nepenthes gracilis]
MANWVRTITSPFRKACTFLNQQPQQPPRSPPSSGDKKPKPGQENRAMDLHGEVMACSYEDVQVMWSMLDKSKSRTFHVTS